MENQVKTPLDIIQELIAVHTTRKEMVEKLSANGGAEDDAILAAGQQSDKFIAQLMTELSEFGDAVRESTNRDNDYQELYKSTVLTSNGQGNATETFNNMETALKNVYQELLQAKDLPESLNQVLTSQQQAIEGQVNTGE